MAVNSVTPAQQADITALYAAFWNRAPDTSGFGFWVQAYANGQSLSSIATAFRDAQEGRDAYPLASTNQQLITEVYQNVFDRAPDAGGLAFWTNALNTMTFPNVVLSMLQAALQPGNDDGALFRNKVTVGEYVAITVQTDNYNVTSHAFDLVTDQPASVAAAEAWVDTQVTGATYTLTTSADIATAQYFDGSLNSFGKQTLQNFDQLTGQRAVNKLDAELISGNSTAGAFTYVTPELLKNIQVVDITVLAAPIEYSSLVGATLDLRNADAVEVVVNDGSVAALTFNNVGGTLTDIAVNNTSSNTTINLAAAADLTEIDLNVSNVMSAANISIPTAETININSHTLASSIDLIATSANTITIGGDADLTVGSLNAAGTTGVESIDASLFEGDLNITLGAQTQVLSTTDITVNSGLGNDTINTSDVSQDYIVTLGAGDDTLVDTTITVNDSVVGGLGYDTLSTDWDSAIDLTATVNGVDGIDELNLSTALNGSITVANVDSTIATLSVDTTYSASADTLLTAADSTVVGAAGTFEVDLGSTRSVYSATDGVLGHNLTITDTGTALTDTLNIVNLAVNAASNTNQDVFNGKNVTSTGYENVVINTGASSNAADNQDIGTLTITVDTVNGLATAPASLTVNGTNALDIGTLSTNSTGLLTVNASGLNVLTTATGLTIGATSQGVGGTASITGSVGADTVDVGNFASTIIGGTGNDNLTGGTAADSITGDAGNDTLSGAGGNDTIHGGAGNDTITEDVAGSASITGGEGNDSVSVGAVLSSGDVVDGGVGVDTLSVTAAITGTTGVGVSNFEVLQTTVDQVMTNTINNSGWTTVFADAASVAISNALAAVTTYQVDATATTTHSFARLVDTATDSLTIQTVLNATPADNSITTFTANDEESITFDTSAGATSVDGALAITTLNAADLKTLTATGDHSVTVSTLAGATGLTTITNSLSANTLSGDATFTVSSGATTSAITFVANGSSTGRSTVTTGSGADVITASLGAALYATGGSGNDTITGGNLADSLVGGTGADSIVGTYGADTLEGGQGADTIVGGSDLTAFFSAVGMNATDVDGGLGDSAGAVVNLSSATLTAAAINTATALYTAGGTLNVASNTTAYLADASNYATLETTQDTLSSVKNVIGSTGTDYIVGSTAANTIDGGAGADTIVGGAGNDSITGGDGADVFEFAYTLVSGTAGTVAAVTASAGYDTVTDFVATGSADLFRLDETVFGDMGNAGAVLDTTHFLSQSGTGAITVGSFDISTTGGIIFDSSAEVVYFVEAGTTISSGSTTLASLVTAGDAVAIATIGTLTGTLAYTDFYVIA